MAEAILELDISPALAALEDLSTEFDNIAVNFAAALDSVITDNLGPQIADIADQLSGVATDAGTAFTDAFGGIDTSQLGTATEDVGDLSAGLEELGTASGISAGGMDGTATAAQGLEAVTGLLSGSSRGLLRTIAPQAAVFAGVTAAIGALVEKADRTQLSVERMNNVFGDQAPVVFDEKLKGLNYTLGDLNKQAGGSNTGLRLAIATFGQTATSAGATREEAARVSQQMGELATIVTTLNPALGTADQNFQLLSRGLGGSTRVLQRYGIQIDSARQSQLALEIAHEHGREKVSLFDKQVAGAQLALENLNKQAAANGTTLQGQVAAGLESSTIKFRALKTEISSALVEIGTPLIEPVLKMSEQLTPVLIDLMHVAGQLVDSIVPAFIPLAQILVDVATPVAALASAFTDLSPAVSTAVAAMIALKVAGGPLNSMLGGVANGFAAVAGKVLEVSPVYGKLGTATGKVIEGLGNTGQFLEKNSEHLMKAGASALVAAQSFDQMGKDTGSTVVGMGAMASTGYQVASMLGTVNPMWGAAAGLVVGLTQTIINGGESLDEYRSKFEKLGSEIDQLGQKQATDSFMKKLGFEDMIMLVQGGTTAVKGVRNELEALGKSSPAAVAKVVEGLKAMHAEDGKPLFTGKALTELDAIVTKVNNTYATHAKNAKDAKDQNNQVAASMTGVSDAAATQQKALEASKTAIEGFTNAAANNLPTASQSFNDATQALSKFGQELTPEAWLQNMQDTLKATLNFGANLNELVKAGYANVAQVIAEQGPQAGGKMAQTLADGIRSGQPSVVNELNQTVLALGGAAGAFKDQWTNVIGPQVYQGQQAAMGGMKDMARYYMGLIPPAIAEAAPGVSAAAADAATAASTGFADNFAPIVSATAASTAAVDGTLGVWGGDVSFTATEAGAAAAAGFASGISTIPGVAGKAVEGAGGQITSTGMTVSETQARGAGYGVGSSFSSGMYDGVDDGTTALEQIIRQMVRKVEIAAKDEAGIKSPSKLFAEIGMNLALGMNEGMKMGTAVIEQQGRQLVLAASSASIPSGMGGSLTIGGAQPGTAGSSSSTVMTNNFYGVKDGRDAIDELNWQLRRGGRR